MRDLPLSSELSNLLLKTRAASMAIFSGSLALSSAAISSAPRYLMPELATISRAKVVLPLPFAPPMMISVGCRII
jgi:hypothetical protein